ncbi:small multi-drug export protein, partial [Sphaerochaeta sp. S2]|nr:small multi-drug export protein [Sphaerochaeta sp. S2]
GAWTGTLGSWILGLDKRKTMMAVFGGVIVSGLIVTSLVVLGVGIDSVFIKRI